MQNVAWKKVYSVHFPEQIIPTMNHGGGSIMIWRSWSELTEHWKEIMFVVALLQNLQIFQVTNIFVRYSMLDQPEFRSIKCFVYYLKKHFANRKHIDQKMTWFLYFPYEDRIIVFWSVIFQTNCGFAIVNDKWFHKSPTLLCKKQ